MGRRGDESLVQVYELDQYSIYNSSSNSTHFAYQGLLHDPQRLQIIPPLSKPLHTVFPPVTMHYSRGGQSSTHSNIVTAMADCVLRNIGHVILIALQLA